MSRNTDRWIIIIIIISVFARVALVTRVLPRVLGDSPVYLEMSKLPLVSSGFLAGLRPCLVPLIYKVCSANELAIIIVQATFGAIAWGLLALTVAKNLTPQVRVIAIVVILSFSFCQNIVQWDSLVLSESLSLSLMVLHIAAWLCHQNRWLQTVAVVVTGILWALSRDTSAYVLAMLCPAMIGYALLYRRAQHAAIAIIFAFAFAASVVSADVGERWLFPFLNTLSQRVLPNSEARRFFSERGMPVSPSLLRLSGKWASSEDGAYYREPKLESFRRWVRSCGKAVYLKFLLSRPLYFLLEPLKDTGDLLIADAIGIQQRLTPSQFRYVEKVAYPSFYGRPSIFADARMNVRLKFVVWMSLCGVFSFVALRAHRSAAIVPLTMIALVIPMMFVVWHGDAMEVGRHSVTTCVGFRLAMWILTLLALDGILNRARSPEKRNATGGSW